MWCGKNYQHPLQIWGFGTFNCSIHARISAAKQIRRFLLGLPRKNWLSMKVTIGGSKVAGLGNGNNDKLKGPISRRAAKCSYSSGRIEYGAGKITSIHSKYGDSALSIVPFMHGSPLQSKSDGFCWDSRARIGCR